MDELIQLRDKIDEIDAQLLPLFIERMKVCGRVAEYKRRVGKPIFDAEREKAVLENKVKKTSEMKNEVYDFFNSIMTISRVRQSKILSDSENRIHSADLLKKSEPIKENPKVVYFGSEGAYSEEAAIGFFGESCDRFYASRFEDAYTALNEKKADYAVLPIENSSTGTISEVIDLLVRYGLYIVGEIYVPIRHCLMGIKGSSLENIKTVYSHEQAFLQCSNFLNSLSGVTHEEYYSTALSARMVADSGDPSKAAIAARRSARLYGLEILAEDINNSNGNTTRFAVISKAPHIDLNCDKISVMFTLKHESGELARVLDAFARGGLNLMKLESRPIADRTVNGKPFEYRFYADYTGCLSDDEVKSITDAAVEETQDFRILGNYRSAASSGEEK